MHRKHKSRSWFSKTRSAERGHTACWSLVHKDKEFSELATENVLISSQISVINPSSAATAYSELQPLGKYTITGCFDAKQYNSKCINEWQWEKDQIHKETNRDRQEATW